MSRSNNQFHIYEINEVAEKKNQKSFMFIFSVYSELNVYA